LANGSKGTVSVALLLEGGHGKIWYLVSLSFDAAR
jgi:hypothetical protein